MKQWIASSATADGARDALSVEILSRRQLKFFIGWRLKSISAASRYKINAIFYQVSAVADGTVAETAIQKLPRACVVRRGECAV